MGIYIPGMEIPKGSRRAISVSICSNGDVYYDGLTKLGNKAIELPAHGRLIDADAFLKENEYFADRDFNNPRYDTTLRELVGVAHTIIPANTAKE